MLALVSSYIASRLGANEYLVFAIGVFVFFLAAVLVNRHLQSRAIDREFRKAFLFRSSSLFTSRRKHRMKKDLLAFRDYLTGLGFDLSPHLLAIGIGSHGANYSLGPVVKQVGVTGEGISIYAKKVNDRTEVTQSYVEYVISRALAPTAEAVLDYSGHNTAEFVARNVISHDLASYFNCSYWRQEPKKAKGWLAAFWSIRQINQDFADSLLAYTVKSFEEDHAPRKIASHKIEGVIKLPNEFVDRVVYCHLEQAQKRVDNDNENLAKIREILERHGLSVP